MNLSGISDIEIVGAVAKVYCPDPDICDVLVLAVTVQPVCDVALQVDTMRSGSNGIVPTVYGCGIQIQAYGLGVGFGKGDPVADLKFGFRLSFLYRLRRNGCFFLRRRSCLGRRLCRGGVFCFLGRLRCSRGAVSFGSSLGERVSDGSVSFSTGSVFLYFSSVEIRPD